MRTRSVRVALVVVLLASLLLAAFSLWNIDQRSGKALALEADASMRLSRIAETLGAIGTAHQGYVAPGQLDEPWFERATTLTDDLSRQLREAPESLQSADAAATVRQLSASFAALTAADARMRENLQLGQELMAADVIFSDGRSLIDAMIGSVRQLQAAEQAHVRAELVQAGRFRWGTVATLAAFWVLVLLVLTIAGTRIPAPPVETSEPEQPVLPAASSQSADVRPTLDLAAVAAVCTDLSRITTSADLPDLLGRAADVLDASGLIVWISAGEQLFPVTAHGYTPETLGRLSPVPRGADNAVASAWRTGMMTTVPARGGNRGAIVTPLFGLHSTIGVLSTEVRRGEDDPAVQAVAAMIAAQLATVVPAWPAGSVTGDQSAAESKARSA
jgi:hypothetical protein